MKSGLSRDFEHKGGLESGLGSESELECGVESGLSKDFGRAVASSEA